MSFLDLSQTVEYANIAPLETVSLGDTVYVDYPTLGVSAKARVIEYEWDSLRERYNSVEIGDAKARLSTTIADIESKSDTYYSELFNQAVNNKTFLQSAIEHASELLKGAYGGHIVIGTNADGQPNEIYAIDTDDVSTAKKVLRINMNGIGGSTTGINGNYNVAITTDGHVNASMVTFGELNGNLIKANSVVIGALDEEVTNKIDSAQSSADKANTSASNAQNSANNAQNTANDASSKANHAQSSADSATAVAQAAKEQAEIAQKASNDANELAHSAWTGVSELAQVVKIDQSGVKVLESANSKNYANMQSTGLHVFNNDAQVAQFGEESKMRNLAVQDYLMFGAHRAELLLINGIQGTAFYWIGDIK